MVQKRCQIHANEMAKHTARFRPGYLCFCGAGSEKPWTYNEERPSYQFAKGGCDDLALTMESELVTSTHPVLTCSTIHQRLCVNEKERRRSRIALQNRDGKAQNARENDLALFVFRPRTIGFRTKSQFRTTPPLLNWIRTKSHRWPTTDHKFVQQTNNCPVVNSRFMQ